MRRRLVVLAFLALCAPASAGPQSTHYQADATMAGALDVPGLEPPLEVAWRRPLSGNLSYPVVGDGKVFVTSGDAHDGTQLTAIDLATGAVAWQQTIDAQYGDSHAAFDAGRLVVITFNGRARAFAPDGRMLWESSFPGAYGFASVPAVAGGRVFYSAAGHEEMTPDQDDPYTVAALSAEDGRMLWGGSYNRNPGAVPLVDGRYHAIHACASMATLDGATGGLLWDYLGECVGGGGVTASSAADRLFVVDEATYADHQFVASTGQHLRTFHADIAPSLRDGIAVFKQDTRLWGETYDGTPLWSRTFPAAPNPPTIGLAPLIVNSTVWTVLRDGRMVASDLRSGAERWALELGAATAITAPFRNAGPIPGIGVGGSMLLVPAGSELIALRPAASSAPGAPAPAGEPATADADAQPVRLQVRVRARQSRVQLVRRGLRVRLHADRDTEVRLRLVARGRRLASRRVALRAAAWRTLRVRVRRAAIARTRRIELRVSGAPPRRIAIRG